MNSQAPVLGADKVPKIIWLDSGRVCKYETRRGALFAVDSLRRKGYEVVEDRDGDFAVTESSSEGSAKR